MDINNGVIKYKQKRDDASLILSIFSTDRCKSIQNALASSFKGKEGTQDSMCNQKSIRPVGKIKTIFRGKSNKDYAVERICTTKTGETYDSDSAKKGRRPRY